MVILSNAGCDRTESPAVRMSAVERRTLSLPMRYTDQTRAVTEHFDETAGDYLPWYSDESWLGYGFRIRKARVLELFDKPGGRVLDVGCGPGIMAADLVDRGCDFWGIDGSSQMVAHARRRFRGVARARFCLGTAERLSFAANVFDTVMCMGVIEFVENDREALKEMVRVLRPEGSLIVAFPNKTSPFRLWRDYVFYPATRYLRPLIYTFTTRPRKHHISQRTYTEESMGRSLYELGCEVTDVVYYFFNLFCHRWSTYFLVGVQR